MINRSSEDIRELEILPEDSQLLLQPNACLGARREIKARNRILKV